MPDLVPDVVDRYFVALNSNAREGLLALFITPDAVVVDEGQTWRRTSEIRTWATMSHSSFSTSPRCSALRPTEMATMSPGRASRVIFRAGPSSSGSASISTEVRSVDWRSRRSGASGRRLVREEPESAAAVHAYCREMPAVESYYEIGTKTFG